jgi:hypothetical protein
MTYFQNPLLLERQRGGQFASPVFGIKARQNRGRVGVRRLIQIYLTIHSATTATHATRRQSGSAHSPLLFKHFLYKFPGCGVYPMKP